MERFSLPAQLLPSFSRLEPGYVSNNSTNVTPMKIASSSSLTSPKHMIASIQESLKFTPVRYNDRLPELTASLQTPSKDALMKTLEDLRPLCILAQNAGPYLEKKAGPLVRPAKQVDRVHKCELFVKYYGLA
jgi:hypothetical protein